MAIISSASDPPRRKVLRACHQSRDLRPGIGEDFHGEVKEERDARRRQVQASLSGSTGRSKKGTSPRRAAMESHIRDIIDAVIRVMLRDERMAIPRNQRKKS